MGRLLTIKTSLAVVLVLTMVTALPALSDTLALRDGTTISGNLLAANQDAVTFRTRNGQTQRYAVRDIEAVQFGDGPYRASRDGDDRRGDQGRGSRRYGSGALVCLDTGQGSTDRGVHYTWARDHADQLRQNMMAKMDTLFRCPAIGLDQLADTFANISVIIPRYVNDVRCFGGDASQLSTDRAFHRNWAAQQGQADALRTNLESKMDRALRCVDKSRAADLFSDVSLALAQGAYQ